MQRPRVLTWHVHGSYLYYLSHVPVDFYVLSKPSREPGYAGRFGHFPWGENVIDMPVSEVKNHDFDCILFQNHHHYLNDQSNILSDAQRNLPIIFLEHDPPRENPVATKHPVDDPNALIVHVTHFNELMWDNGNTPTTVIPHGVVVPSNISWIGNLQKGIVIVNHLNKRGRRLGSDIFTSVSRHIPLDLIGMEAELLGGVGEVQHSHLPAYAAHYRFLFNPIRYTSLGLSVCEAMMLGIPIVGLATTEMVSTVENGVSGFIDTNVNNLIEHMKRLLNDPQEAKVLSEGAKKKALQDFNINRFVSDWSKVFSTVTTRQVDPKIMRKTSLFA